MNKDSIVYSDDVKLTIYLKLSQIKRNELPSLTYSHLLKVLFHCIWDKKEPVTIHEAVNDIMNLDINDIIISLHSLAIIEGGEMDVNKIEEFIGGRL